MPCLKVFEKLDSFFGDFFSQITGTFCWGIKCDEFALLRFKLSFPLLK